jgi:hypothetical protein
VENNRENCDILDLDKFTLSISYIYSSFDGPNFLSKIIF